MKLPAIMAFLPMLAFAAVDHNALAYNSWTQLPLIPGVVNSGGDVHWAGDSSGNAYIFGACTYGGQAGGSHNSDVYRFNLSTGLVELLSNNSNNRLGWVSNGCQNGVTFDATRNCLWIGNNASGTFWKFMCPGGPLTQMTSGATGSPYQTYVSYDPINDVVYSPTTAYLRIYDCKTNAWRTPVNYPFSGNVNYFDLPACADTKRGLFIITLCGPYGDSDPAHQTTDVWAYNPATSAWTKKTPPQTPQEYQYDLAYDPINDKFVYFGGHCASILWVYDWDKNFWFEMPINGRAYNDANPSASTWPPARHKHAWSYSPKYKTFVNWAGGGWTNPECTDADNNIAIPIWIWKPLPYDTGNVTRIEIASPRTAFEQFQTENLSVTAYYANSSTRDVTAMCAFNSIHPLTGSVSSSGMVTGLLPGIADIRAAYWSNLDTLRFTFTATSMAIDSMRITPESTAFMAGESQALTATGYYHNGTTRYSQDLGTQAVWNSSAAGIATVSQGMVTGVSAGSSVISAQFGGKSDDATVRIMPKPGYIKRINFQVSSTPWKYGWLADNGNGYNSTTGYGWSAGLTSTARDDRMGNNFLLKSFVVGDGNATFKINAPDGAYILRLAMGDNQYGSTASTDWTMQGTDTLIKHAGQNNLIKDVRVVVTGGQGLILKVKGPLNYLVLISDQGIDMNAVADDGYVNPTGVSIEDEPVAVSAATVEISPNPFNPAVNLSFKGRGKINSVVIYDSKGALAEDLTSKVRENSVSWNASSRASGLYFAVVRMGEKRITRPLMLVK